MCLLFGCFQGTDLWSYCCGGGFILKEQVKMTAVHVVCAWQDIGCHQCMKSLEATGCEGFAP